MNIKNNIKNLIEENNINEAERLINKYNEDFINDIEFLSMKAIVLIINEEFEKSEEILLNILDKDEYNCDCYFNLGYIYEKKGELEKAIYFYGKANENSNDKDFIENTNNIIGFLCELKKKEGKTSIIILTYNKLDYTKLCIESIRKYTKKDSYEIIIVDNNSTDDTRIWLKEQNDIKIILNEENLGFPGGCNVGILVAEKDNDIMLINNDTIVTPRWLENLKKSLYSNEIIGAVGPVTNNCPNYQSIEVSYDKIEDLHDFSESYNIYNPEMWEEKVKLIGYCMLIKREVINKVGLLDEVFFPGNFEDDDLSYRIQREGYKLILCKDTFIHHFGNVSFKDNNESFKAILSNNSMKFIGKWGFDSEKASFINHDILENIDFSKENINLLHVGCESGATLYKARSLNRSTNIYGIDKDKNKIDILNKFIDARVGSLTSEMEYESDFFDYIIITDYLDDNNKFKKELIKLLEILKPDGEIIIKIKNSNYYQEIVKLILGKKNENTLRLYNIEEIKEILNSESFENILIRSVKEKINKENTNIIDYLSKINNKDIKEQYITEKYIVSLKKRNNERDEKEIEYLLRRIENDINYKESLNSAYEYMKNIEIEKIFKIILKSVLNKDEIANILAIKFYKENRYEETVELLNFAYDFNNFNKDVVFNIASLFDKFDNSDLAISYLNKYLSNRYDEDIFALRKDIMGGINE